MSTHFKTIIFAAGIALGIIVGLESTVATELAMFALALGVVQMVVYVVERKRDAVGVALSLFTLLFAFAFFIGVLRVHLVEETVPFVCATSCTFDATVVTTPETKDTYQVFVIRPIEVEKNTLAIQVRMPLYPRVRVGETLRVSGKVTPPDLVYPHTNEQGMEKSFDYQSYLHARNIGSQMMFPKTELIDMEAHTVPEYLGRMKEDMVAKLDAYVSSPASALASGMLFGNSSMSSELVSTFRIAGLSHIVVLSGFNIAIVIAFALFAFAFLPLFLRIALASLFVVIFVLMVGGEASVIRATGMAFIGLLAVVSGREYVARQALIISFLGIIMYDPQTLLYDVSLHLSFIATAGIIYLHEPIKRHVSGYVTLRFFLELITTSVAAYIATLPYVTYMFGTISTYGLIANVLALPLVPVAMLTSFVTVVCAYFFVPLALVFGYIDTVLGNIIIFIAEAIEVIPFSGVQAAISFETMCVMYVLLVVGVMYTSRNKSDETFSTTKDGYITDVIKY